MSGTFPTPVERWLDAAGEPAASLTTAILEGRTRFRREGKGPWLPIEARMWHELGVNHVADLRVGLGPISFVRGMDGYVDGTGFGRIGHTLDMGPEIDQAAALFMWAEAVLFPSAWQARADVVWNGVDDVTADISLPFGDDHVLARVTFDPATRFPSRFVAERYKGVGSRPVEWVVDYQDWRPTEDGVTLPGLAVVTWSDEPGPWFKMWIQRANPGADVSSAMARGRELLAEAAADPTR